MIEYKPTQLQASIVKLKTMTHSWRIELETQDNVPGEIIAYLTERMNKLGWFTYNVHQVEAEDIIDLPEIKPKKGDVSKSQKLRAVIFRLWEQDGRDIKDKGDFNKYYDDLMDRLIQHYIDKLS